MPTVTEVNGGAVAAPASSTRSSVVLARTSEGRAPPFVESRPHAGVTDGGHATLTGPKIEAPHMLLKIDESGGVTAKSSARGDLRPISAHQPGEKFWRETLRTALSEVVRRSFSAAADGRSKLQVEGPNCQG